MRKLNARLGQRACQLRTMRIILRTMRKKSPLDCLFPKVRQAVLAKTLLFPHRSWYLSDLAKEIGLTPSSLQRELSNLVESGVLIRREEGNRVYFQANPDCPFLQDLQGLLAKTAGIVDVLREALGPISGRILTAFVYGSIAQGKALSTSDVDLMVVGEVGLSDLAPLLRDAEKRLGREVNATTYSREEFAKKVAAGDHFVRTVLGAAKLPVVGRAHELAKTPSTQPSKGTRDKQARNPRPSGRRIP